MTRHRSVFLSDVHLGTPDCRADYLLDFLRQLECDQLYLAGDIIDLEALTRRSYWPDSHSAVLAEMFALAARGVQVTYIPGNHDAPLRGLVGQSIAGIEVKLWAEHLAADGRRYRVSHGDEFDPEQTGKRWLLWLGEHGQRLLCWIHRGINRMRRGLALPYLPLTIIAKSRIGAALNYIRNYEQRVANLTRELGFDGAICGHIHFGNLRELDGVRYCNDGDWVEHCTALVENECGDMALLHWSEHRSLLAESSGQRAPTSLPTSLQLASFSEAEVARWREAA